MLPPAPFHASAPLASQRVAKRRAIANNAQPERRQAIYEREEQGQGRGRGGSHAQKVFKLFAPGLMLIFSLVGQ